MRAPGMGTRYPGGDGQRYPGGMIPRRPGGGVLVIPSGGPYGPYGPGRPATVVEIDDDPPPRRITKKKPQKPKVQQAQQVAPRGGFDVPPAGEQRFVQNEVLLNVSPGTSNAALDSIARRHRLTRLELRDFAMTRRRLARLRINDGRAVASVIRSLQADARILGAQPNFLYSLEQGAAGAGRSAAIRARQAAPLRGACACARRERARRRGRHHDRRQASRSRRRGRGVVRRDRRVRQAASSRHRNRRRDRRARQAHRRGAGGVHPRGACLQLAELEGLEHERAQGSRLGRHVQGATSST